MDLGSQDLDRLQSSVANELISLPTSSQRDGPESASTETHGPAQQRSVSAAPPPLTQE